MPLLGFMNPFDNSLYHFDPDKSIPRELSRQVIIVTGGNSGCGKETVLQLAKHNPRCVYLAARSKAKYDAAMKDISAAAPNANVRYLELDLASLASVKKAADSFLSENDRLDVLVNNAGIMAHPHGVTKDGYELQFGTNYLGPALLTYLLLPLMQRTAQSQPKGGVRIVNVSSFAHNFAPKPGVIFDELDTDMKSWGTSRLYGQSKLANILHARELARRYPDIISVSLHPGRVDSNLGNVMLQQSAAIRVLMRVSDALLGVFSAHEGALTQLWATTWKKEDVKNGAYYMPVGKVDSASKFSQDPELAKKLWNWTENEFKRLGYVKPV
ncbi:hypothetical protein LTR93_002484 [Exophiala xenobiotica]|nr:hypothetical protein LTR93_002484 [Exophiala xenobiotica]